MRVRRFEYWPDDDQNTCKHTFVFRLRGDGDGMEISSLEVLGQSGCQGHPTILSALLRGHRVSKVPVVDLACAQCAKGTSCGVHIANAIQEIRAEYGID